MIKVLLVALALIPVRVFAGPCTDIAKFDEEMSKIYVVCPELPGFSDSRIAETVHRVLTSRTLVPDEYTVDFVISSEYLSKGRLTEDSHVGFYYTHSNEIVIWPKNPEKKRTLQLEL